MKKLIIITACLSVAPLAFGQGELLFGNRVTAAGINAIVTDGAGNPLDGGTWMAQLYAGATADSMVAVGDAVGFRTGAAAGYITSVARSVAGSDSGTSVFAAMAAWDGAGGMSYDDALVRGMSAPVQVTLSAPPATPAPMAGLQSFSVAVIPEPSTMALGMLGIGALMLRRRR
jgi:hypothetical protein